MPIPKKDIYRAKLTAIKSELMRTSQEDRATTAMAENFNDLLVKIADEFPDIADELPARITSRGPFARMGKSDVQSSDIRTFAEQVIQLIALCPDK